MEYDDTSVNFFCQQLYCKQLKYSRGGLIIIPSDGGIEFCALILLSR